ncbi:ABC transporter ATP-binding protein [Planomicrobium sp. CPCC 101110]|uniref:ABC transporter ATP-binding protein n=1 Tax=Planomicrobium sp. CPCC 101110 TaxID=2599619 RepID=UPI0011B719E7|nr:ABC transporter ATP-binding protein [Planomicrobium sp. CPCC 101110]TWT24774.1 ABC transporter ATP-binding protein [Planomicrobium sp. CPCC 101110]
MKKLIEIAGLSKNYKGLQAVGNLTLSVGKGEIYGFIGLNGSGKTTTIRMLLGMIKPTSGTCFIHGEKVSLRNHAIWKKVGYMVETPHAYPELTVRENLHAFRRLRLISDPEVVDNVINRLKLKPYADKKAKNLSLGNAQRLGIAKALLHKPEILILDEPVNGLDPAGIVEIREFLRELAFDEGVAIFISSHLLTEIAKIATKVGIIHQGRLVQEVESARLHLLLNRRLVIGAHEKEGVLEAMASAGFVSSLNRDGFIETYDAKAIQRPDDIARFLVYQGFAPTQLAVEEEDLETYFLRIIGQKGEGGL